MDKFSDSPAERSLRSLIELFDASGGVIFERDGAADYFAPTAILGVQQQIAVGTTLFSSGSLLPRWLRVNAKMLSIPDSIGVCAALDPEEREALRHWAVDLAVPLMVNEELVAWAGLCRPLRSGLAPTNVPVEASEVASTLHSAKLTAAERARSEAVVRSNRLSVAGQMAAGIAHEIRNPLAAVRSMVQLMQSGQSPVDERERLLGSVIAEVDRVNRALSGMLTLGRPTPAKDERVDLTALAVDAVTFCQSYAKHRGETIRPSATESHWVLGDAHELRQVLINLIMNACQASRRGDVIDVECDAIVDAEGRPVARVKVSDCGEGVPLTILDRIFEPFFTTKPQGGGLGLSICRDSVQRHGGNITVTSEPSVGTIVSVELPVTIHGPNSGR